MENSQTVPWRITKLLEALEIMDFRKNQHSVVLQAEVDVFLGEGGEHHVARFVRMAQDRSPILKAYGDKVLHSLAHEVIHHISQLGGRFFCRQNSSWTVEVDHRKLVEEVSRSILAVLLT